MARQWIVYSAVVVAMLATVAIVDAATVAEILEKHGLPSGLLPSSVESYTLSENGKFTVQLEAPCYAKIQNDVYYASTITGDLSFGMIQNLAGIQAKEGWFWFSVTGIVADPKVITFQVGPFSKELDISFFSSPPICKSKKTFPDWLSQGLNGDLEVNVANILEETMPRKLLQ